MAAVDLTAKVTVPLASVKSLITGVMISGPLAWPLTILSGALVLPLALRGNLCRNDCLSLSGLPNNPLSGNFLTTVFSVT